MSAKILKPSIDCYRLCSAALKEGKLVAFPTETVYGLGANALNREAVCDIFKAKNRPFNDPVIVHVLSTEDAEQYVDVCEEEKEVFRHLTKSFWPGPLTIVMKAKSILPKELSAGTGKVGFRCPSHEIARQLIKESGLPIAAPSANRFGHISPTRAEHVFNDLKEWPVLIIDGGEVVCRVGIESTVIGIDVEKHTIILFRRGGITEQALRSAMKEGHINYEIDEPVKHVAMKMEKAEVAPGQLITHYAPYCDTFLMRMEENAPIPRILNERIQNTVILDFNGILSGYKSYCLQYMILSEQNDIKEVMRNIYGMLRQAEQVKDVKLILLPDLSTIQNEFAPSVMDRMVRATSGRLLTAPSLPLF